MRKNEQGYSLVTTLLVITIFFLLGLTIVTAAVQHAQFTTVRVDDVQSLHEAKTELNEALADLKAQLSAPNFFVDHRIFTPNQWDQFLGTDSPSARENTIAGRLTARYGVTMTDESEQYNIPKDQVFLRALRLSKQFTDGHQVRTVERLIFVTNTPSFLKYALGSNKDVVLNGGVYVEKGNVYAGQDAYASNATNYVKQNGQLTVASPNAGMPRLSSSSVWYTSDGQLMACGQTTSCWTASQTRFSMSGSWTPLWPTDVVEPAPSTKQENEDFIDVDFDLTVADKLLQASDISRTSDSYLEDIQRVQEATDKANALRYLAVELSNRWTPIVIDSTVPIEKAIKQSSKEKPLYLDGSGVLTGDVDIRTDAANKVNQWLIVNGDLTLNGPTNSNHFINVYGNFIVFGNMTITGNVKLDASIYVMGKTKIYQSRVERAESGKGVVLLSKGTLDLSRINEFDNPSPTPNLKGYFYTDSSATIYAVGSYLYIEGGLFARGNGATAPDADVEGLVVNAFRGQVNGDNGEPGQFTPINDPLSSRLIVRYRPEVLIEQGTGLPFVNRLSLVVDRLEVK
ncbi:MULTISPECIES: hypothetical protein [Geobacillus]|uniref:Uncharacterized protein n=1 Tax=Geobacillus zalihae TaxID=213419 RepID=A0A7H1RQZ6_9BACL|nr:MULTISPECIES: hypothetical protein [Geobacillus]KMY64001.1 hypothetical protein AA905_04325 [Geobacillus stearothermophilus]KMY64343.1 hypothetical protein AA904_00990 [Geobacillus stearothermophilus]MBR2516641.1 hypothetical protein [Geobacillus sp.]OQP21141.1 hypothetical protein B1694_12560 [Geobacillus zalihae]QNU16685.1 hypothetical protein IC807_09315 [Geobacillus zalihae]